MLYELSTANSTRTVLASNTNTTMNRLVFNTFSVPTGNSYQLENSYAAFSRQRAAVLGPVKLDQTETVKLYAQQSDDDDDRTKESGLGAST